MENIDDLLPMVSPHVIGCPQPIIKVELINGIRDFCKQSYAWQYDADPVSLRENISTYELPVPRQAELVAVLHDLKTQGAIVKAANREALDSINPAWEDETGSQVVRFLIEKDELVVYPKPTVSIPRGLTNFKLALMPSMGATQIDSLLFSEYYEGLAASALFRLLRMPKKPWTDINESAIYGAQYRAALSEAKQNLTVSKANVTRTVRRNKLRGAP